MTEYAIETKGLTKQFGDLMAVDNLSLQIKRGEIFGFLGPNGAGKTTTIRMLCTLNRPTSGSAKVAGHDVLKQDRKVREHIGLVSEKMIMYDRLTAYENLKLFGKLYSIPKEELDDRIMELLRIIRMDQWADTHIGKFSTGMKQRINVIRALLNQPQILFLDEPTLGLDPQSTSEIREFIRKINTERKTTIILTTHIMVEADLLCDRIGIIDQGKMVANDTSANLKKIVSDSNSTLIEMEIPNLTNDMVSAIENLQCSKAVSRIDNTRLSVQALGLDPLYSIMDAVREKGGTITSMKNNEPTLEDVFLHITGNQVHQQASDRIKNTRKRMPYVRKAQRRVR